MHPVRCLKPIKILSPPAVSSPPTPFDLQAHVMQTQAHAFKPAGYLFLSGLFLIVIASLSAPSLSATNLQPKSGRQSTISESDISTCGPKVTAKVLAGGSLEGPPTGCFIGSASPLAIARALRARDAQSLGDGLVSSERDPSGSWSIESGSRSL
ncbi:hypothetical protein B0H17DRAFT_1149856 [Mycena rosella]|uniref:Uncharacterized protein n=1 Tax=Mycena rosella TaxID=1033263 RepID=A0AAD7BY79_MYCRO|nr:hypothetical protein B0H17DRAFT_1149856 [Mycena rosella]